MRALNELRQEGKARHIGVSNYTSYELGVARSHAPVCAISPCRRMRHGIPSTIWKSPIRCAKTSRTPITRAGT